MSERNHPEGERPLRGQVLRNLSMLKRALSSLNKAIQQLVKLTNNLAKKKKKIYSSLCNSSS